MSEESQDPYAGMTIPLLPGWMAVRKRPEMYFGVTHDDSRLPEKILRWVIRDTLIETAVGEVLHVVTTVHSDLVFDVRDDGPGIRVEPITPTRAPWLAEMLTGLWCGQGEVRGIGIGVAAALCSRVTATTCYRGHRYAVEMNDDRTTGPVINLGTTAEHGSHLTFWLDRSYLADDVTLPAINADITHELLAEVGRPEPRLTIQDRRDSKRTFMI